MKKQITLRDHLLGGVTDFCQKAQLELINNAINIVELIVLLAKCQEEGLKLFPKVYLFENILETKKIVPGSEFIKIAHMQNMDTGNVFKAAIKKCAPLANIDWSLYIHGKENDIEFGVFRGGIKPFAVPVDEVLMSEGMSRIVKIHKIAEDCIEVTANNGDNVLIILNHDKQEEISNFYNFNDLIKDITRDIKTSQEETANYLKRALGDALKKCHGCILAVTASNKIPLFLAKDGIILETPLDFNRLVINAMGSSEEVSTLDSTGGLIQGILNTDGITVFDTRGKLIGYNCFVKNKQEGNIIGGARKRTFETLCKRLRRGIVSVFMQSQDNWSSYKRG